MKRILLAGLLGGVMVFLWGAVAHMVLEIDAAAMKVPSDAAQARVMATLGAELDEPGVYLLPMLQKELWKDEAAQQAFAAQQAQSAFAFLVFQPQGVSFLDAFGGNLMRQAVIVILAALFAAWVVSLTTLGFVGRVALVGGLGLFAWLTTYVPLWNWYRFPTDYTVAALIECVVGWLLAGLIIAAIVKPRRSGVF